MIKLIFIPFGIFWEAIKGFFSHPNSFEAAVFLVVVLSFLSYMYKIGALQ